MCQASAVSMCQVTKNQHMSFCLHKNRCKPFLSQLRVNLKDKIEYFTLPMYSSFSQSKNGENMQPIGKV